MQCKVSNTVLDLHLELYYCGYVTPANGAVGILLVVSSTTVWETIFPQQVNETRLSFAKEKQK